MHFGSNEMMEQMLLALEDESKREEFMCMLDETVCAYTTYRIKRGFVESEVWRGSKALRTDVIDPQDYKDLGKDVFCRVIVGLDNFIRNYKEKGYNEKQRQAWLRRIVYNVLAKHLKRCGFIRPEDEITEEPSETPSAATEDRLHLESLMKRFLAVACGASQMPEKILAFLFNGVILKELMARKTNSSAKTTCSLMNGKTLFELKNLAVKYIRLAFDIDVSDEDIAPVCAAVGYDEPTEQGKRVCGLTEKTVTDWTHRVRTYVFERREMILGKEAEYVG